MERVSGCGKIVCTHVGNRRARLRRKSVSVFWRKVCPLFGKKSVRLREERVSGCGKKVCTHVGNRCARLQRAGMPILGKKVRSYPGEKSVRLRKKSVLVSREKIRLFSGERYARMLEKNVRLLFTTIVRSICSQSLPCAAALCRGWPGSSFSGWSGP